MMMKYMLYLITYLQLKKSTKYMKSVILVFLSILLLGEIAKGFPILIKGKIDVNKDKVQGQIPIHTIDDGAIIQIKFIVKNQHISPTFIHVGDQDIDEKNIKEFYSQEPLTAFVYDLDAMWDFRDQYINLKKKSQEDKLYFIIQTYDQFRNIGKRRQDIEYEIIVDWDNSQQKCAPCLNGGEQDRNCKCEDCNQGFSGKICSRQIIETEQSEFDVNLGPYEMAHYRIPPKIMSVNFQLDQGLVQIYVQLESFEDQVASYYNVAVSRTTEGRFQLSQFNENGVQVDVSTEQKNILITFANRLDIDTKVLYLSSEQQQGTNVLVIVMAILGGLLFVGLIVAAICIVKKNREQSGRINSELNLPSQENKLTTQQIERFFPSFILSSVISNPADETSMNQLQKPEKLDLDCVICLEQIQPEDTVRIGYCRHIFHSTCLIGWLKKQRNCPYCRREYDKPTTMGDYEQLCKDNNTGVLTDIQLGSAIYKSKVNSTLKDQKKMNIQNIQ